MRLVGWVLTVVVSIALPLRAVLADEITVTSKVERVTVYPSGAEVTREAMVSVPEGQHVLILPDLPSEVVAQSIRVAGEAASELRIGSVDTRKLYVPQTDHAADKERRRLETQLEALEYQKERLQWRIDAASAQRRLLENLANLPNAPQAGPGEVRKEPDWQKLLGLIGSGMESASGGLVAARAEMRQVDRRIGDLRKTITELAPKRVQRTEVKVHVTGEAATEAKLAVSYQVRNASWTPSYEARLDTSGGNGNSAKLDLFRRASVTQRTGEDWKGVEIRLSTARPAATTSAPNLKPVFVDFKKPAPPVAPRPSAAMRLEDAESVVANEAAPMARRQVAKPAYSKRKKARAIATRVEALPFQAIFAVPGRADIPAHGERKMLLITRDSIDARLKVKSVPKLKAAAYLYATFKSPAQAPLLPGAVSLFRNGVFVGKGRLPLLSEKEHELGFGADDKVRVTYADLGKKRGEAGLISTTRTDQRLYKVTITNTHDRAIEIEVLDQLPVSRDTQIEVASRGSSRPSRERVDDKPGLVAWDLTLKPGAERVIDFSYVVRWPSDKSVVYGAR